MARVISWQIAGKYVYIEKQGSTHILDSKLPNSEVKAMGSRVTNWPEATYSANFAEMRSEVVGRWGESVDLRSDYQYYFNATGEEGVYMLTGIDGANIADYGKEFYNLVIENNNTSLGLGGDYRLDAAATLYTTIYLERNGEKYAPDSVSIKLGVKSVPDRDNPDSSDSEVGYYSHSVVDGYKWKLAINVPRGTQFDSNEHILEYTIRATKGTVWDGEVVFTVVGVKDGEEGVSYDLLVSPRVIKVNSEGEPSAHYVVCKALKNGEDVSSDDSRIKIMYDFGEPTLDADDLTYKYSGNDGISYDTISQNDDQINFYLLFNNKIVDSDSCYISRDGQNGAGFVKLELTNEMDGIAVGSDTKLDLEEGKTISTGTEFILYSGGTKLSLTGTFKIEGLNDEHVKYYFWTNTGGSESQRRDKNSSQDTPSSVLVGQTEGNIVFEFENGFEFGEDYKDSITITIWGTNGHDVVSGSSNYLVMGIRGGKDGDVYKIVPNLDAIMCDPNSPTPYDTSERQLPTHLTVTAYLGLKEIENANITYSIDVTYTSSYGNTTSLPDGGIDIVNTLLTSTTDPAQFVTFYLWTSDTTSNSSYILVDRETVPIIWHGTNGISVWIELGNELDAVSVGDDTDLDLGENESVEIGTTVMIVSGDTHIPISNIKVVPPAGTEANWNSYTTVNWAWDSRDNGTHTIARLKIQLKNGFDFGSDYREQVTILVSADTTDSWTGFTSYVIKGIKGGKDGYVYRLVPETDYVYFHPNEGNNGMLEENNLDCTAYYGKVKLGEDGFKNGKICYSINMLCDVVPESGPYTDEESAKDGNTVNMTILPSGGIDLGGKINKENYTEYKYVVFYLLIQDNDESPWEIVDRESVPIVADGLNASENVTVELTNEIDSIGIGTDTVLDLSNNGSITASTNVRMFSGATELKITSITGAFSIHTDSPNDGKYQIASTPVQDTNDKEWTLSVVLRDGFNFGNDLREKVNLVVNGENIDDSAIKATGYATFVVAGIKGGKDGVTYKIQPTPDVVLYDLQNGQWAGNISNVTVRALMSGKKMSDIPNQNYQIRYSTNSVMDFEVAGNNWGTMVEIADGGSVSFTVPTANGREQSYTFYLAVREKNTDPWTIVDRETVPLVINGREGKDGKDGTSAPRFDILNPIEIINTGTDTRLDVTKTYTCTVYGYSGFNKKQITVNVPPNIGINSTVTTSSTNDNGVYVNANLFSGFDFGETRKREVDIDVAFADDSTIKSTLKFTLMCVIDGSNGEDGAAAEGDAYRLRTNVPSVVYDGESFSPEKISAAVYLGPTMQVCTIYFRYYEGYGDGNGDVKGLDLSTIMNRDSYTLENSKSIENNGEVTISGSDGIIETAPTENGAIYVAAFKSDGTFLDYEDIPVTLANLGGGSSGILADLTDDVGVVATGDNKKLEANTTLKTKVFVKNGFDPVSITKIQIEGQDSPYIYTYTEGTTNKGTIQFSWSNSAPANEVEITAEIIASESSYIDFTNNNPIQFNITITGKTAEEEAVYSSIGYSILGLKGGKDGQTVNLVLNADQIFYDSLKESNRFSPNKVKAKLYVNGEDVTESAGVGFDVKNSDMSDASSTEQWLTGGAVDDDGYYSFDITEDNISEFLPLTIQAKSGNTVMDWETVQVYRNGKDGEGGLEAQITPSAFFIPVDGNNKPKANFAGEVIVGLFSGSAQDSISNIIPTTDYGNFGEKGSGKHVEYEIVTDSSESNSKYKIFKITATTDTNLSELINISLLIQSATDMTASGKRYASVTLNPSTGGKGPKGPITRLRDWQDYLYDGGGGDPFFYQAGGENEEYKDFVFYIEEDFEGGYYECIQSHFPRAQSGDDIRPQIKTVDGEKIGTDSTYWKFYPMASFTASKVACFGEHNNGWLIDSGKIQHTSSSITLNGENAAIEMRDMDYNVYRYKNGGDYLYTRVNYRDEHIFNENKGSKVTVYTDEACSNAIFDTYVLSGTSSAPTLVLENKKKNIPITLFAKNGQVFARIAGLERPIVAGLDLTLSAGELTPLPEPDLIMVANEDITVKINALCYYEKVEKIERSNGETTYKATLKTGSTANFESVIKAGAVEGSKPTYNFYTVTAQTSDESSTSIKNAWKNSFSCYPEQILLDRSLSSSNIRMSAQEQSVQARGTFEPADDIEPCASDFCNSDSLISIDETATTVSEKYYFCITGSTITSPNNSELTEAYFKFQTKNDEINYTALNGNMSYAANIKNRNDVEINSFTLQNDTVPSPPSNTEYTYDPLYNSNENTSSDEDIKPLVTVINGDVNGADYGDIILAAGIPITNKLYKYTNANYGDIYTIGNKTSLPKDTEIIAFMGIDRPVEIKAKVESDTKLSYNGNVYTENGTPSDPKISKYASTRIYGDGEIISSKVFATDGSFNGDISARSGNFFGGLNASGCNIYNATIDGQSMFNGTVIVPNGGSLNITNGNNDTLFIAANDAITNTGERKYAARRFNKTESGTWFGLGSKTETGLTFVFIEDIIAISNDTVTFPKFVLEVSGKKISNLTAKLVFTGVQSLTENVLVSNGTINDGSQTFSWTTGDTTYRANGDNISVKMVYSYTIGGGSGNISFSGRFERQIAVGTRKIAPYYAFGNNGLFLSTGKGNITLGGSGLYLTFGNNSIEVTQNDMIIKTVSGGYEYSMSLAKMMSQFADVYGTEINLQGYITRRTL